jgi:SAM-dependent methyltransferase
MMTKINVLQDKGTNCPICLEQIVPEFIKQHNQYKIYRCPECDVVYSEPFTNPGQEYYGNNVFSWPHFTEIPMRWQFKVFLSQGGHTDKRLLDIGCDNGSFLYHARNRGYRVVGIDLSSTAIVEGRKFFDMGGEELLCTNPVKHLNILAFVLHLPAVFFFSLIGKEGSQQYLLAKSRV